MCLSSQQSPTWCLAPVSALNTGGIVSTSSSASGEVALEKLKWRRKVTAARGEERWRLGQQSREE